MPSCAFRSIRTVRFCSHLRTPLIRPHGARLYLKCSEMVPIHLDGRCPETSQLAAEDCALPRCVDGLLLCALRAGHTNLCPELLHFLATRGL